MSELCNIMTKSLQVFSIRLNNECAIRVDLLQIVLKFRKKYFQGYQNEFYLKKEPSSLREEADFFFAAGCQCLFKVHL